ncbi:hypothetical protein SDRG_16379 [Saprolegnia diclina VS20]|uniref:CS domain-containing protein n=1 Tax=Saprolegnia diclina (strain VS20) TaxID=1156394 RepID=T0R1A4_SAPDV|nr:hypothetical protein SDRG_16379 [Saprolegnia diclina VS20]EQC25783.1 hypothetical protein SDRG_16379 [Saprolegnia diclina VS20]|eukprot:XP_008620808.1 hypothetical protein SDRG_16379 [Saprolegnia diclina VS20]
MQWFVPYIYVPNMDMGIVEIVTPIGNVTVPLFLSQFYGLLVALGLIALTILWHVCGGRYEPEDDAPYTKRTSKKAKARAKAKATKEAQATDGNDADDDGDGDDGPARSALAANISRNGENSYYYAHKVREIDNTPMTLKQTISQYGWSDGRKTVTIYVDHPAAGDVKKDAVSIHWSATSLSLDITFDEKDVRSLVVPKLYGPIADVSYKAKRDSLVFTLVKKQHEPWKSLNAAAKNLDAHIEYDESLYD